MIYKLISKSFNLRRLNGERIFYLVELKINSDTGCFPIRFVKISGSNEIP